LRSRSDPRVQGISEDRSHKRIFIGPAPNQLSKRDVPSTEIDEQNISTLVFRPC
jgi:hypothetical protein